MKSIYKIPVRVAPMDKPPGAEPETNLVFYFDDPFESATFQELVAKLDFVTLMPGTMQPVHNADEAIYQCERVSRMERAPRWTRDI